MTLRVDPEFVAAMAARKNAPPAPQYPEDDVETVRAFADERYSKMSRRLPQHDEVVVEEVDAAGVPARLYTPPGARDGAGLVVYLHGGGMWRCNLDTHDPVVRRYAAESGVRFLSVDYRMAPEFPYPQSQEDGYTALSWVVENAASLGVDPKRLAIAGDSAGGGLAAGIALMTRDRGEIQLALQVLIYPMLDDRTTMDTELAQYATWTYEDNAVGWRMLLGETAGTDAVAAYAAPARAEYFGGLPPTYIEVGVLDIYRDEDIEYGQRLASAGVPLELHVHDGVTHAFELINPNAAVSQRAFADRARVFGTLAEPVEAQESEDTDAPADIDSQAPRPEGSTAGGRPDPDDDGHDHDGDELVGDVQQSEPSGPTVEGVVGDEPSGGEPGPEDDAGQQQVHEETAAVEVEGDETGTGEHPARDETHDDGHENRASGVLRIP